MDPASNAAFIAVAKLQAAKVPVYRAADSDDADRAGHMDRAGDAPSPRGFSQTCRATTGLEGDASAAPRPARCIV